MARFVSPCSLTTTSPPWTPIRKDGTTPNCSKKPACSRPIVAKMASITRKIRLSLMASRPIPQRNETVTLVTINFTAVIGDRLRDIEKELADQRFCADWTKLLREPCGIVDIEKDQDLLLDHRAVISADRQVK